MVLQYRESKEEKRLGLPLEPEFSCLATTWIGRKIRDTCQCLRSIADELDQYLHDHHYALRQWGEAWRLRALKLEEKIEGACKRYVQYKHHEIRMWVREDLKGKHREHCLCYNCKLFNPDCREKNCEKANVLYNNCVMFNLVTPVWECDTFDPIVR